MGYRHTPVIVRPSDLRASPIRHEVAQAMRSGRVRFVGFDASQGDPSALLAARMATTVSPVDVASHREAR